MTLAQAKVLQEALSSAIAKAEADGSDSVALAASLSAELGESLDDLAAAIAKARQE